MKDNTTNANIHTSHANASPYTCVTNLAPPTQQFSSGNNVALGLIGGAFFGILALTTPFVFAQLRSPLPYMATPRYKIEKALKFVADRRQFSDGTTAFVSKGQPKSALLTSCSTDNDECRATPNNHHHLPNTFVDLGSGDGTAILTAASQGYYATGFELNPTLWLISSLRRIFSTNKSIRSNSHFILGDMFHNDTAKMCLRHADCVMIFGVNSLMPQIATLIQRECCRPGCLIMSYRFRVPLMEKEDPFKIARSTYKAGNGEKVIPPIVVDGVDAALIYDEEEMRIYQLNTRQ